jgi:hypothetical protein
MSPSKYPGELRRLGEHGVGGQHEAREVRRNIRARRLLAFWYVFKNRSVVMTDPSVPLVDALRIEPPV